MACTLLDACGLFMYRSADSHQRCKIYLEQMMRKKAALSLDSRYVMMIENVYYNINPPETPIIDPKQQKTPRQEYIHKLLYADLSRAKTEKVSIIT